MEKPQFPVSVIMQRRALHNRWQSEAWEPAGVLAEAGEGAPRLVAEAPDLAQWLYPGMQIGLRAADADGYFLNLSTNEPCVFVLWRLEDGRAVPHHLTLSYSEASSWMDGGEQVDRVPMPREIYDWASAFVERHYRPPVKQRIRPQSFKSPKDRARG